MKKIFDPSVGRPMEVVPWGSGSGTNIEKMIQHSKSGQTNYRVVAVVYDVNGPECKVPEIAKRAGIRSIYADSAEVRADPHNKRLRADYYSRLVDDVHHYTFSDGSNVDLVPLGGFMLKITDPALSAFSFVNVHPAFLNLLDVSGRRKYTGGKAVLKVVNDRLPYTGSTVHILTDKLDQGEILVRSRPIPVPYETLFSGDDAAVRAFADEFQRHQKALCDWPAYVTALDMISKGRLALEGNVQGERIVYLNDKPLPYSGWQLPEAA